MNLKMSVLENTFAIYRYPAGSAIPSWIHTSDFFSVTKTSDELSVVAIQNDDLLDQVEVSKDWRILKVMGPLDFSLVGIIAGIANVLKKEGVSIFTISTYDTDYIMVKEEKLTQTVNALREHNYTIKSLLF